MGTRKPIGPFYFDFTDEDLDYFQIEAGKILRSGTLILGQYTTDFEKNFAAFIGTKHAISVNTGSTALEILLRIKNVTDKTVLVPTNTNFATVAAVMRAEGRVQYLDMDESTFAPTLHMVKAAVEKQPDIAGILWVHIGGVVSPEFCDVVEFCHRNGLFVLEDAAHAHGSAVNGKKAGALADGAAFSFFPTKVMTTGEGGMITTDDDSVDFLARSYRNQGKRGVNYGGFHEDFGNSSRMTELSALLGTIQLRKLDTMLQKRRVVYETLAELLRQADIRFVSTDQMTFASNYKFILLLKRPGTAAEIKKKLAEEGIILGGAVYEIPCHKQPVFASISKDVHCPIAERWCPNHICPPITSGMTAEDAAFVAEKLIGCLA